MPQGLAAVDLHHDPDRLDHPQLRSADGTWRDTGWDEAMAEWHVGGAVVDTHGPNSTAAYIGSPMAFNALGSLHVGQMLRALGVRRSFSSGTQDCANKFVASEAVFGSSNVPDPRPRPHRPVPRHRREPAGVTGRLLLDPQRARLDAPSRQSWRPLRVRQPAPDRDARAGHRRHGAHPSRHRRVVPRRPPARDRPARRVRDELVARHGRHLDGLRRFIAPYSPDATEAVTGVPADTVRELARAWVDTPRASVHASTGINMGRQGTLAYWLVHMLSFVTGRLDVEGGNLKSDGFYPNARSGQGSLEQGFVDTEFGRLRRGSLPGTLMSHAILDSDEPIRAMIVVAGNPLLSIAGQQRLRKAFEQLELLVVIDIYPSATAELAHVVLPSTDMYERDDLNIVNIGTSAVPFAQYTPAVVEPAADRKPEWWIAHRVLQELGAPSLLDDESPDPWAKWRHMLAKGSGLDLADLQADGQARVLPAPEPGRFFDQQVHTVDGLVDCCPSSLRRSRRCTALWDETRAQLGDGRLRLIHRRDAWMHNTWFANLERMKQRSYQQPARPPPDDADRLGLSDGDEVVVTSDHGEVTTTVEVDGALMAGVVSMVHGWGHTARPRLRVARTRRQPSAVADR
ncbi:MAG: molybdopterin-dependent oxidoreductase [Ilumatobacteraceae bacterium]